MESTPPLNIELLLQRIAAGDVEAFAAVVGRYQRPLFGFLGRLGLSQAQAEELAQDTFLRAWRALGSFQPQKAAFSTWLFAIARNLAIDELNRLSRQSEVDFAHAEPELACESPQPLATMIAAENQRALQAALRQLPMTDRSALALVYSHELDLVQVARIEGCSPGAIKVRLHRARLKLRELLEQKGNERTKN